MARALAAVAALVLVALAALAAADKYDELCDAIIAHGQEAAKAHNGGDPKGAEEATRKAEEVFKKAVKMDPGQPQAFANIAVFYLNSQKFEKSLEMWEKAKARVDDPGMLDFLEARIQHTKYGFASSRRDKAYNSGQGNITEALHWCEEQERLLPSPEVLHDKGTMMVMLGETDPSMSVRAVEALRKGQRIAYKGWLVGKKSAGLCKQLSLDHDGIGTFESFVAQGAKDKSAVPVTFKHVFEETRKERMYGTEDLEVVYEGKSTKMSAKYRQGLVYIAEMQQASLSGVDGVISDAQCRMVLPSGREYLNLPANVQMVALWQHRPRNSKPQWHDYFKGRYPNHGMTPPAAVVFHQRAVSIVSYAVMSYYHWVMEGLGRLVLLQPLLEAEASTATAASSASSSSLKIIVPKDTSGNKFVTQFLELLPFKLDKSRIVEHITNSGPNDVRFDIETLYYPDWEEVRAADGAPSHCLTPPAVLERVRATFVPQPLPTQPVVVYAVRDSERMRRLDNEALLRKTLEAALPAGHRIVLFRGSESDIKETIALFASAAAVVGVHGGALANIVFCAPGTPVVEIGLRAPQTRHFLHASQALGLDYHLVLLNPDERSVGAASVSAREEDIAAVGSILKRALATSRDEL